MNKVASKSKLLRRIVLSGVAYLLVMNWWLMRREVRHRGSSCKVSSLRLVLNSYCFIVIFFFYDGANINRTFGIYLDVFIGTFSLPDELGGLNRRLLFGSRFPDFYGILRRICRKMWRFRES